MIAAKTNSPEAVYILLNRYNHVKYDMDSLRKSIKKFDRPHHSTCNTELTDKNGLNALAYALRAGHPDVIYMLSQVTKTGLDPCIKILAQTEVDIHKGLSSFIDNMIEANKSGLLLEEASFYGNSILLEHLKQTKNFKIQEKHLVLGLENAIKSDEPSAVKMMFEWIAEENIDYDKNTLMELAKDRGNLEIIRIFGGSEVENNCCGSNETLRLIPKTREFPLSDIFEDLVKIIIQRKTDSASSCLVPFEDILKHLHAPEVHFESCPSGCSQTILCSKIRGILVMLEKIMLKMAERNQLFEGVTSTLVGSLKEQTVIGKINELDFSYVQKSETLKNILEFDRKEQKIKIRKTDWERDGARKKKTLELPKELKDFISDDENFDEKNYYGYFDVQKYFFTFLQGFYDVLSNKEVEFPDGITLSTDFSPCQVCKVRNFKRELFVRCRHQPECENHKKKILDTDHQETCDCENYDSPCLSYSKIGLVLHVKFEDEDGQPWHLDIDISPPALPVSKKRNRWYEEADFDGSNRAKREWLEKHRPVRWKEEWFKTEDLSDCLEEDTESSIRLRFYNDIDVIPEESLWFLKEGDHKKSGTLAGNKSKVYVVMKILRNCSSSNIKSFKVIKCLTAVALFACYLL